VERCSRRNFLLFRDLWGGLRQYRQRFRHAATDCPATTHRHAIGNLNDHDYASGNVFLGETPPGASHSAHADREVTVPPGFLTSFGETASGSHFTFRLTLFNRLVYWLAGKSAALLYLSRRLDYSFHPLF
jgi:hypothetical protein